MSERDPIEFEAPSVPQSEAESDLDAPRSFPLLRHYLGDVRTLFPGACAGIMQLMYPPLGAAVAAQSDFFADPFGRVYRSIPQIWATILAPDGNRRARWIRDVHRNIKGEDAAARRFHALDPETYWWAHATFTWEVFEAIRLLFPGGLEAVDQRALYAETVGWYQLYGVSMRPVPPDLASFRRKFDSICETKLEMTPAATRTLEMALAGEWRAPLVRTNFKDPLMRGIGRRMVIGSFPGIVRERFHIPWSRLDQASFDALCLAVRQGMRFVPESAHRRALSYGLRFVGESTRDERFVPRR